MKLYDTKAKSWVSLLVLIALFFAMTILGGLVALPFTEGFKIALSAQAVSSIVMFGGTAFVYCLLFERKTYLQETFFTGVNKRWLLIALALWVVGLPALNAVSFDSDYGDLVLTLVSDTSWLGLFWLIIVMALLPAVLEEWIFRGILQRLCIRWTKSVWFGILLTSSIFSLIHLDMPNFFARLILGIVLGLLYQYSGNIWTNIFYHFVNNCMAAVSMWLYVKSGEELAADKPFALPLVIVSAVLMVAFVVYNERKNPKSMRNNYIPTEEINITEESDDVDVKRDDFDTE